MGLEYLENNIDENDRLEYKEALNGFPKSFWETYSAFGNTSGGTVVLGIKEIDDPVDLKHKWLIQGVSNPKDMIDTVMTSIHDEFQVNTILVSNEDFEIETIHGKTLIFITIHEADDRDKPVYLKKDVHNAYIRENSADIKAKGESLKNLIRNSQDNLDTDVLDGYDLNDLDYETFQQFRIKVLSNPKRSNLRNASEEDFLKQTNAMTKNRKSGKLQLNSGGLLFLGNNSTIIEKFPYFQLDYFDYRVQGTRWRKRISSVEDNLNIYSFFMKVMQEITSNIDEKFKLDDTMSRSTATEDLIIAIREGLVNMLQHADYFANEHVILKAYWDYFEFSNPGKMKIPADQFFASSESKTRNPNISKMFVLSGFSERAGSGGNQIYKSSIENNYRKPEIDTNTEKTTLKIWYVDYADSIRGIDDIDQKNILKFMTKSIVPVKLSEIERATGLSRYYADQKVKALVAKKVISKIGNARATRFEIPKSEEEMYANIKQLADSIKYVPRNE